MEGGSTGRRDGAHCQKNPVLGECAGEDAPSPAGVGGWVGEGERGM